MNLLSAVFYRFKEQCAISICAYFYRYYKTLPVYPRRDVIEFYDTAKGYLIKINGNEMEFDRIQYGLLIFLAKALKADQNCGKVAVKDAVDENIVRDPQHFYRLSGELNKLMKSFVENKKDKIINKVKGETGVYRYDYAVSNQTAAHQMA